ncbi:MAG: acyltransferase [Bacteroidales bacterium]
MNRSNTIELVDFLKGFSIFTIVVFHVLKTLPMSPLMTKFIFLGGTGIHAFMLISGFGLYLSWIRRPMTYLEFLKKRFVKIYVPYIFVVTLIAIVSLIIPIYKSSWYYYLGHVLLYKTFDESIVGSFGDHFWFLSTIFQFYFIFPVLVKLKEKLSTTKFMAAGMAVSFAWILLVLVLGKEYMRTWNSFFFQYMWEFMLGMVLAAFYVEKRRVLPAKNVYILLLGLSALVVHGFLAIQLGGLGRMVNDIPALMGYTFFAVFIYRLKKFLVNRFFLFTATISFSLYLMHVVVLKLVAYYSLQWGFDVGYWSCPSILCLLMVSPIILIWDHLFYKVRWMRGKSGIFTNHMKAGYPLFASKVNLIEIFVKHHPQRSTEEIIIVLTISFIGK